MSALDPGRIAEILVSLDEDADAGRRGTGYQVTAGTVLTAAHVVRAAGLVRVRFDADQPGERTVDGEILWADDQIDIAVLGVSDRLVDRVVYGAVPDSDIVLDCVTAGFPRFKLREDRGRATRYRDLCHAVGTCAALSNRRSRTLEISVPPPEHDPDPRISPWEGMSGAAVWNDGRIIGVVTEHHRADGLARLAATRVDRWRRALTPERWQALAGLIGLVTLVEPPSRAPADVTYRTLVRDIAPSVLRERQAELAELTRFCAGDEPYAWWQGPPWAGKTAMASWFVLHPPSGVVVVSFFITARLAGQADSNAYTAALISQLAALIGVQPAVSASSLERDAERRWLLNEAVSRMAAAGQRLLLVVDGLDEDQGREPSIASLLPPRPPPGLRILVTSRPFPGIPADVPGDHPLRRCEPSILRPFGGAHDIEADARRDLARLRGEDAEIIGLLAAAGGGLTISELAALTGRPQFELRARLSSSFGRVFTARAVEADSTQVIMFAHETLRVTAEAELGSDLIGYRERIHRWAGEYAELGWPDTTPRYLLQSYGSMLASLGDVSRLAQVAADPARQNLMLAAAYSDTASLTELDAGLALVADRTPAELRTLAVLCIGRDRVTRRGAAIPQELPGVWARLGRAARAEALARSLHAEENRAWALADVACIVADQAPDLARQAASQAEWILRRRPLTQERPPYPTDDLTMVRSSEQPLLRTIEALARTAPHDGARRLAAEARDPIIRSAAWRAITASGKGTPEDIDAATAAAQSVPVQYQRVWALTELALVMRETDPSAARGIALQAHDEAAKEDFRWSHFTLGDLNWMSPERAHYRRVMDILRDRVKVLTPGPDDETLELLAEASARCGLFFHVDLVDYALARASLREPVLQCFTAGLYADLRLIRQDTFIFNAQSWMMENAVQYAVTSVFLKQGRYVEAKAIGLDGCFAHVGRERWTEALADWAAPAEAERAIISSRASPAMLARLAARLAATDPVTATRLAGDTEDRARDIPPEDAALEVVSACYSLLGRGDRAEAVMSQMSHQSQRLAVWNAAALRKTDPVRAGRIGRPDGPLGQPGGSLGSASDAAWHLWALNGDVELAERTIAEQKQWGQWGWLPAIGASLARILADSGHLGHVQQVAARLAEQPERYIEALSALARAYARTGQPAVVQNLVNQMLSVSLQISEDHPWVSARIRIVAACAQTDPGRARAIATTLGSLLDNENRYDSFARLSFLTDLAVSLRHADRPLSVSLLERAYTVFTHLPADQAAWRSEWYARTVAVGAACLGLWDLAEQISKGAGPAVRQAPIASIMAGATDPGFYLQRLQDLSPQDLSGYEPWLPPEFGLIGAATSRAPDSPTDLGRARRLIAESVREGHWVPALAALVRTDPDVALDLCDRVYAQLPEGSQSAS